MNTNPPPEVRTANDSDPAFLLFQVGPVQEFIAQARKTRDLWSGSYLISYLSAQAMLAVADALGDDAIVYPAFAGSPLARLRDGGRPSEVELRSPCLPNRFLALVPAERGLEMARLAEQAVRGAWGRIIGAVEKELAQKIGASHPRWNDAWKLQVGRFPSIDWLVHPWSANLTAPSTCAGASEWARHYAATEWLFAARKSGRAFAGWESSPESTGAHKDHLDGRNEALGSGGYAGQKRLRDALRDAFPRDFKGEQLYGALSVIKRRWDTAYLRQALGLAPGREWFPDVPFIAQLDKDIEAEDAEAERYYAVLMMDGDDLGQWLSGEKGGQAVTREYHRELSQSLAHFALHVARPVVEAFGGYLIYSGGDDALAMLPAAHALDCAQALMLAFRGVDPTHESSSSALRVQEKLAGLFTFPASGVIEILATGQRLEMIGPMATASVGIAVGHVRAPMQETIQAARDAERAAKARPGKAAFCLAVRKRSGEAVRFHAPWESGVAGVWGELQSEPCVSARVAQHFAVRVKAQVVIGGSATGARYAPEWTPALCEVLRLELRHVLTRQAGLPTADAARKAARWMAQLLGPDLAKPALAPGDFLHFWLAWAFLRRTEPATVSTAP